MSEDMSSRERDLVLAPNEFAFISDQTKGNINVYVGPYKTSLANTDKPVVFNPLTKRFEASNLDNSIQIFPTAPEGWYVVIKNPPVGGQQPKTGTVSNLVDLEVGKKVNIPGPVTFALWPGQMGRIIQGHQLRTNQYLVVRVYDEAAALENWSQAVIKRQATADGEGEGSPEAAPPAPDLTIGRKLVIKGTEVSFYIPPTGVEVLRDDRGNYVREAVTLERLEYCILLDEDGQKRFIQGPAVVFPEPTEAFVARQGTRKFRAIELNENSGLYIKVIAPYADGEREHKVGEELFITGREQMIYFPRTEHAIIKYGDQEIHYAVAIPKGEGRYCLDRLTGQIRLVRGPTMFLPDPRKEVIARRVLHPGQVRLWFPGNEEALAVNRRLKQMLEEGGGEVLEDREEELRELPAEAPAPGYAGDDFQRRTTYTPPRTITLDTKYEGAVTISVWTGYAVKVVSRSGERKVITGPETYLLEYDESLEAMSLSTGTPKTDRSLMTTVYLRCQYNKVSDVVRVETRDLCQVQLELSYRVNFEGEPERWFNVENYVRFLTDHLRSQLRNAVKRVGIQEFHADAVSFVRDTVLGAAPEGGKRPGRTFSENGMRIYDVEVLDVKIGDKSIERLLVEAQHAVVSQTLAIAAEQRELQTVQQREAIRRQIAEEQAKTREAALVIQRAEIERKLAVRLAEIESNVSAQRRTLEANLSQQEAMSEIRRAELARDKAASDQDLAVARAQLEQRLDELRAEVEAVTSKASAVSPDLVAALQAFSDRAMVERVAESMAPLAILGGDSVAEVIAKLLKGTALERVLTDRGAEG
jgi:major vault protein